MICIRWHARAHRLNSGAVVLPGAYDQGVRFYQRSPVGLQLLVRMYHNVLRSDPGTEPLFYANWRTGFCRTSCIGATGAKPVCFLQVAGGRIRFFFARPKPYT